MRFFKRMSQAPDFTGFSACLLSHSSRREVEDELENQAFRLRGGRFHGTCCPIQPQRLDELASVPEDAAHEGREARKAQPPLRQVAQVAIIVFICPCISTTAVTRRRIRQELSFALLSSNFSAENLIRRQ